MQVIYSQLVVKSLIYAHYLAGAGVISSLLFQTLLAHAVKARNAGTLLNSSLFITAFMSLNPFLVAVQVFLIDKVVLGIRLFKRLYKIT